MKINIWGYYGTNYGDNIMLMCILQKLIPLKIKVSVISTEQIILRGEYSNIKTYDLSKMNRFKKVILLITSVSRKVLNVYGGGTIFTNTEGDGNYNFFHKIARLKGKIAYLGIGMEDLVLLDRIKKAEYLLKKSSFITFRDRGSLDIASKIFNDGRYFLTEDLVYPYLSQIKNDNIDVGDYIVLAWRSISNLYGVEYEEKLMNNITLLLFKIAEILDFNKILLLVTDEKQDKDSTIKLSKKLSVNFNNKTSIKIDVSDTNEITNILRKSRFNICARLHCCIVSEYFNVPTLAISYSRKIESFYESIAKKNYIKLGNEIPKFNEQQIVNEITRSTKTQFTTKVEKAMLNLDILYKNLDNTI